ncbi:MAG TPA: hypothetical protein VI278_12660 [Nitrososphaeraceae archaeon]
MSAEGIEDKDDPIALIDKMISCKIFNEPEVEAETMEEYYEKYYDLDKLEFTDKFDYDFEQTLLRLASDLVNDSLSLLERLKSILLNYLKGNEIDDAQDIDEMVMMVISVKTLRGHIRKR